MRAFSLLILLILMPWGSFAAANLATQYRSATLRVLRALELKRVHKIACIGSDIDCLTPAKIAKELTTIKFKELKQFQKDWRATRWGAFYDPTIRTIYLNQSAEHNWEIIGYIGLHETLGVLNRPEPNFEISMAAYQLLSYHLDPKAASSEADVLRFTISNAPSSNTRITDPDSHLYLGGQGSSGGGVVVGGGSGDTRTLKLRIEIYNKLRKYVTRPEYMPLLYLSTPIEISKNPPHDEITYDLTAYGTVMKMTVPEAMLDDGKAMDDIVWFLRSLNPRESGIKTKPLRYLSVPVSFSDIHPVVRYRLWGPLMPLIESYQEQGW